MIFNASSDSDIEAGFATIPQRGAALLVSDDPFLTTRRSQIIALVTHYAIPAIWGSALSVRAGGLMSYGANSSSRAAGRYVGRILNGDNKPADLPVLQPTTFEFAINLKTAKALGLEFPPSFHLRATEVIE
jgi:putative ABC transport system substrate-binding protein